MQQYGKERDAEQDAAGKLSSTCPSFQMLILLSK
jgi:hypothetical protein